LVLDLDETLVHFDHRTRVFQKRPYVSQFLSEMAKNFELVVFTAGLKEYADWILNQLDTQNTISHRLYRNSCIFRASNYLKDLGKLGRDLSKTIIIDNIAENFNL